MKLSRFENGSPEIFRTIQGEGPSTGYPAVFLRLSLCNLHCVWCDTPYTWNWENTPWKHEDNKKYSKKEQIIELNTSEIASLLTELAQPGDRLVITGGEPLLQQTELLQLLPEITKLFSAIEIETNGTQQPSLELDAFIAQYNVSPKLSNSDNAETLRRPAAPLTFFANCPKAFFKFVVADQTDLEEILSFEDLFSLVKQRTLLMPLGRTSEALAKSRQWVAQTCLQHGFRFSDRIHIHLWGDKRGR